MKKMTLEEIGKFVRKSATTINSWKYRNPQLLEVVKLGAFCKKYNITLDDIKTCIKMKELAKKDKSQ